MASLLQFFLMAAMLGHCYCRTKVPPEYLILDTEKFIYEVTGYHWAGLYCVDDDDNWRNENERIQCAFKAGIRWAKLPDDFTTNTYLRKSAEIWQPIEVEDGCPSALVNVEFIIYGRGDSRGKAILHKVGEETDEVHRIFSSVPDQYIFIHVCFDDTTITLDNYCPDSLLFLFVKDLRSSLDDDLNLSHIPWQLAAYDLYVASGIILFAPPEFQKLPPPHPNFLFEGPECEAKPLDSVTPHSLAGSPFCNHPFFSPPGNTGNLPSNRPPFFGNLFQGFRKK